jgi:hypothetical protein
MLPNSFNNCSFFSFSREKNVIFKNLKRVQWLRNVMNSNNNLFRWLATHGTRFMKLRTCLESGQWTWYIGESDGLNGSTTSCSKTFVYMHLLIWKLFDTFSDNLRKRNLCRKWHWISWILLYFVWLSLIWCKQILHCLSSYFACHHGSVVCAVWVASRWIRRIDKHEWVAQSV